MQVYKITNKINNKCYIGITRKTFRQRYNYRDDWWNASSVNSPLRKAVKKYGSENFIVEILKEVNDLKLLNELEVQYIINFNCMAPNGYNLTTGGEHNYNVSEQSKIKNREKHLGKPSWNKGLKTGPNPKLSEKLKGKTPWNKGKKIGPMSKETILKSSKGHFKAVLQLDSDGNIINEFESVKSTQKYGFNPSQVSLCCKHPHKYKTHRNYKWMYKGN